MDATKKVEDDLAESNGRQEEDQKDGLPSGILRLREEWRLSGLPVFERQESEDGQDSQVIFPQTTDGAPVGDYTLLEDDARTRLRLSKEAFDRLIASRELDSILMRTPEGVQRFLSVASLERFEKDSAIDSESQSVSKKGLEAIEALKEEIEGLRAVQGKQLQQTKDMLLLELRNLKEQDRDLTSYVYELTQLVEECLPKRKKRR